MNPKRADVVAYIPIFITSLVMYFFCVVWIKVHDSKVFTEQTYNAHATTLVQEVLSNRKILSKDEALNALFRTVQRTRAVSVVIYDVSNKTILAEKNSTEVRSLASLTKLVTATLAYDKYVTLDLKSKVLPRIQNMLTTSSNEEAESLASVFGNTEVEQAYAMNQFAEKYGLTFRNASGLDIVHEDLTREPSSQGSARGIAQFASFAYEKYPELFDTTILPKGGNTNIAVNKLDFIVGGKTGFTDLAGGNLMVILQKGITHKYVVVVLGSTENGRFVDVENIASALVQLPI